MSEPTSLYRFYDARGVLLYIGITNDMARRFGNHGEKKSWHPIAVQVSIQHYPSREAALAAEAAAIVAEAPLYNIQHNMGRHTTAPDPSKQAAGRWEFKNRRSGYRRQCDLVLYPELDCSAMVDDYYHLNGDDQLREYVRYLEDRYPQWLEADAVPIYWSVETPAWDLGEGAPPFLGSHVKESIPHFLDYFTWPTDVNTGERLDWFSLPVVNDRFPEFAEALAWTPSPFQPSCPLATILRVRGLRT
jgi:hypothetical protein